MITVTIDCGIPVPRTIDETKIVSSKISPDGCTNLVTLSSGEVIGIMETPAELRDKGAVFD